MALASFLVLGAYFSIGIGNILNAWPMLRRMRWLFLSIILIYVWMAPSPLLVAVGDPVLPYWSALMEGGYRVAILVILILAVHLLVSTTQRDQFVSAIYWLSRPLGWMEGARERLALRIVLVMESLTEVRGLAQQSRDRHWQGVSKINAISSAVSDLFVCVLVRSEAQELETVELELGAPPPVIQWGIPLLLLLVMGSMAFIGAV